MIQTLPVFLHISMNTENKSCGESTPLQLTHALQDMYTAENMLKIGVYLFLMFLIPTYLSVCVCVCACVGGGGGGGGGVV